MASPGGSPSAASAATQTPEGHLAFLALAILTLLVAAPSLSNGFAYDDVPIIQDNARVHALAAPWTYASQTYWPAAQDTALYRPLTIWLYAVQWALGNGAPWLFHLVSVALYLAVCLALYAVARALLPFPGAWLATALFIVHPVHVEAVANVVGQAELTVGLATMLAVGLYLQARRQGVPSTAMRLALAGLALGAGLAKEQGLLLPGFLLAAEIFVVEDHRPWRSRIRDLAPLAALLLVTVAIILGFRGAVLMGLGEGAPEIALRGLGFGGRVLTMLGVVPEWTRLLLWPAHLSADYSPPGIDAASHLGRPQVAGLLLLAVGVAALVALRRRAPAAGFGLAWCALALAPVSNLVFPTGILLAERTLFLPSAGLCLALGALVGPLEPRVVRLGLPRAAVILGVGAMLAAALVSSARRQRVWRDTETLFARTIRDAPTSYRAFWTYGTVIYGKGRGPEAEAALRHAVELYPHDPQVYEDLGQMLRRRGDCAEALPLLVRALEIDAERVVGRSRLFYCRLAVGDILGARTTAAEAVARGQPEFGPLLAKAESLLAAGSATRP